MFRLLPVIVKLVLWSASIALVLSGPGCNVDSKGESPSLNRGLNGEPASLDPHLYSGSDAATVLRDIGEGLLTLDSHGEVVGGMAREWQISDDGKIIDFVLRDGLRWSNGEILTSDDIVRSFRRLVDPIVASPNAQIASNIQNAAAIIAGDRPPQSLGVFADGASKIRIILEHPAAYFPQILSHPALYPTYQKPDSSKSNSSSLPITNGAYRVENIVLGSAISLVKNEYYWNQDNVSIRRVTYHIVDQNVEPIRFEAGEIDITDNVSEFHFQNFRKNKPELLRVAPMLGVYYYGLNQRDKVLSQSLSLRRALSLAIDRNVLVSKVLSRGELPAYRFVPPGVAGYSEDPTVGIGSQEEREALAQKLVADISKTDRIPRLELRYNTGGGHERIAVAIAGMWRKVLGIEVDLRSEELKVFLENAKTAKDTQILRLSWTGDYNDAYSFLQIFESTSGANMVAYTNPQYDALLANANAQQDSEARKRLLELAEDKLLSDLPVIPIYFYVSKHLVSLRVVGWEDNVLDVHLSQHLRLGDIAIGE